jgi:hypothetical protein
LGGALGVFNIVHDERLAPPYRDDDPFGRKPDPLRKRFRSPQSARRFLSEVYKLKAGDETVVFMTDHCWGLTFGGSWPRSKLGRFNLDTQTLDFVAYHGNRI